MPNTRPLSYIQIRKPIFAQRIKSRDNGLVFGIVNKKIYPRVTSHMNRSETVCEVIAANSSLVVNDAFVVWQQLNGVGIDGVDCRRHLRREQCQAE